jgi:hypothetical protein
VNDGWAKLVQRPLVPYAERNSEECQMKAQARNKFSHIPTRLGLILALVAVALGAMVVAVAWAQPGNPDPDPDPGTHSAPVTTSVSITYDEPIDAATVTSRTFAVHAMQTGLVGGIHSVEGNTIRVAPVSPFYPGELVQATATTHTPPASLASIPSRPPCGSSEPRRMSAAACTLTATTLAPATT